MNIRTISAVACAALLGCVTACSQNRYPFQDSALDTEKRIDNILSLMTIDEKIGCLEINSGVPRLGIPNAGGSEGLHGLSRKGDFGGKAIPTTQFAEVIGMAETWDPALIQRAGTVQGYEARYIYNSPKYNEKVLIVWGPNSDLARDPRWGRNNESYGEDPFFTGTMAVAFIRGMQGDDPKYWQAASLMKHFFANSNETTRGKSSSDFDDRLMREYYSVPFRMGVVEGGSESFMTSYNAWNGVPMTVNPVVKNMAIKEWGLNGIISSDATAIELMVNQHHYYKTMEEAAAASIKAGISQILAFYLRTPQQLKAALADKSLTVADIDADLRGKFRTLIRLGLLDPPAMVPYAKIGAAGEPEPWTTDKNKSVALQVARESVVLLKNAGNFLPLDKSAIKSIAVVGPQADKVLIDQYSGNPPYTISPLKGIKDKLGPRVTVTYAANNENDAAVRAAKASDVAVVVVGNHPICGATNIASIFNFDVSSKPCADKSEGREGRDRESIDLTQEELVKQVYAANPKTVMVLVSSFPYAINWSQANVPAILHTTHSVQEQGTALADVLFGDYSPAGRTNQTWPKSLDQLPPMMDYNIRDGRTYMYFKGEPLYPFGYGLSYTTFSYSNLKYGNSLVSVDVTNTGKRTGDEVVQLYVQHLTSKVERPNKELKGLARVSLQPGQKKTVRIPFKTSSLAWWNKDHWEVEPETIRLVVGGSSADVRLQKAVAVKK